MACAVSKIQNPSVVGAWSFSQEIILACSQWWGDLSNCAFRTISVVVWKASHFVHRSGRVEFDQMDK